MMVGSPRSTCILEVGLVLGRRDLQLDIAVGGHMRKHGQLERGVHEDRLDARRADDADGMLVPCEIVASLLSSVMILGALTILA